MNYKNYIVGFFHGVAKNKKNEFAAHLNGLFRALEWPGKFGSDNLITWGKSLGFLDDPVLMRSYERHATTDAEKSILWRTSILAWAARRGMRLRGDLVECGSYRGTTARILCDVIDIDASAKKFWLYDAFEWNPSDKHHYMEGLGQECYEQCVAKFDDIANKMIIKGYVPESFSEGAPAEICFLHIDMNNSAAEMAALNYLFDRVVPGGIVVFDDYGWLGYREQKIVEDAFFEERGYSVLELPTGQGLVIK